MARQRKRRNRKPREGLGNHHLCWTKRSWTGEYTYQLRTHPYCIVQLPETGLHQVIHRKLWEIPRPREENARLALEQIAMLENSNGIHRDDAIEKRLIVLIALFECIEQPTADAFKKQLAIVRQYQSNPRG